MCPLCSYLQATGIDTVAWNAREWDTEHHGPPQVSSGICRLRRHRHSRPLLLHVFQLTGIPVPLFGQTWAARPEAFVMARAARVSGRVRVIVLLRETACGGLGSGGGGGAGVGVWRGGEKAVSLPTRPGRTSPILAVRCACAARVRFLGAVPFDAKREIFYCTFAAKTCPEVQGLPKCSDFLFSKGHMSSVKVFLSLYSISCTCR